MDRRSMVAEMTEEQFQTQKNSVQTKLAEKDKNMSAENKRFWSEITTNNYDFDRQANELKALQEVTLDDFKAMFESTFFSAETKRLDLELTSAMHTEKQAE